MKLAWRKSSDRIVIPFGSVALHVGELALDPRGQLERVGARLLLHRQHDARLRVHRAVAVLGRRADAHVGDLAPAAPGTPPRTATTVCAMSSALCTRPSPRITYSCPLSMYTPPDAFAFEPAAACTTSLERHACGEHARRVGEHLVLLHLAADRDHLRDARHGEQPAADRPVGDRAQLLARVLRCPVRPIIMISPMTDDTGASTGAAMPAGSALGDGLQLLGDDLPRAEDVGAPVELDPHDGDALRGRRAHAPHAGGAVHRRLDRERDERLDLLRRHAVRLGEHRDRRRGEVGEDVDRHARRRPRARRRA